MGWIDREYIPAIRDDWRYARLFNLTRRLLEERMAGRCGNCTGGQITVRADDGTETAVTCPACGGTGEAPTLQDNEDNGQVSGPESR